MDVTVAIVFVVLALVFVFVRLSSARKAADELRQQPLEEAPAPAIEGPPPPPPPALREGLGARVRALLGKGPEASDWDALHDLLLKADVGPAAATDLVARVRARWTKDTDAVALLRDEIAAVLGPDENLAMPDDGLGAVSYTHLTLPTNREV